MRLRAKHSQEAAPAALLTLPATEARLRDEVDPDPLVEQMVERLRRGLADLVALDAWGRPTPWREVVRLALGPALLELRDGQTASALAGALEADAPDDPRHAAPGPEPVAERPARGPDLFSQPAPTSAEPAVEGQLGWPAQWSARYPAQ